MINFQDKHVIITGGSSGIGKAVAKLLASQGANISIIARNSAKLALAKQEITSARLNPQQKVFALKADVSQKEEIETAIEIAMESMGGVDILVTCAGIAYPGYFKELPMEIFEDTMAINYFGSLYAIIAVLPAMEKQKKGHLVLISSGAGLIGIYGYTPYSPTKFALRGLAESLRGELKPSGINVSIVYPPDTDTPQLEAENKTKPRETKLITGSAQTWNAQDVAREIVKGILKGKFAITPGLEMGLLSSLHSFLAPILHWYFDRIVTQVQTSYQER